MVYRQTYRSVSSSKTRLSSVDMKSIPQLEALPVTSTVIKWETRKDVTLSKVYTHNIRMASYRQKGADSVFSAEKQNYNCTKDV